MASTTSSSSLWTSEGLVLGRVQTGPHGGFLRVPIDRASRRSGLIHLINCDRVLPAMTTRPMDSKDDKGTTRWSIFLTEEQSLLLRQVEADMTRLLGRYFVENETNESSLFASTMTAPPRSSSTSSDNNEERRMLPIRNHRSGHGPEILIVTVSAKPAPATYIRDPYDGINKPVSWPEMEANLRRQGSHASFILCLSSIALFPDRPPVLRLMVRAIQIEPPPPPDHNDDDDDDDPFSFVHPLWARLRRSSHIPGTSITTSTDSSSSSSTTTSSSSSSSSSSRDSSIARTSVTTIPRFGDVISTTSSSSSSSSSSSIDRGITSSISSSSSSHGTFTTMTTTTTSVSSDTGTSSSSSSSSLGVSSKADYFRNDLCVICYDCRPTVVLFPCRHVCLCIECEEAKLSNCPICRTTIKSRKQIVE